MLKWRIELDVDSVTARGEEDYNENLPGFDFQMKSGKAYFHGADKETRSVFYTHLRMHRPNQQSFEVLRTFIIYNMETGRLFLTPPLNQCSFVFDLTGFGLGNMDWPLAYFLIKVFETYYPETLGTLIIHNAPWVFSGIWKVLSPLVDIVVRQKIRFTQDKELFQFIEANQVPKSELIPNTLRDVVFTCVFKVWEVTKTGYGSTPTSSKAKVTATKTRKPARSGSRSATPSVSPWKKKHGYG